MKKLLISGIVGLSLISIAGAQQAGTSSEQLPPALPPVMSTGSTTVDLKVNALRQEYNAKLKALHQEYLTKLKALIGERKEARASTTQARKEEKREMKASSTASSSGTMPRPPKAERPASNVRGTSTENLPQGNAWGFFRRLLGL